MNTKLIDSLITIIDSLNPTERNLLEQKLGNLPRQNQLNPSEMTAKDRLKSIQNWDENHSSTILLSDFAVSREGIYQEDDIDELFVRYYSIFRLNEIQPLTPLPPSSQRERGKRVLINLASAII